MTLLHNSLTDETTMNMYRKLLLSYINKAVSSKTPWPITQCLCCAVVFLPLAVCMQLLSQFFFCTDWMETQYIFESYSPFTQLDQTYPLCRSRDQNLSALTCLSLEKETQIATKPIQSISNGFLSSDGPWCLIRVRAGFCLPSAGIH